MKLVKDPNHIRLGIIGMTEGNGHPYSWSAMFNKFDREAMPRECPFPVATILYRMKVASRVRPNAPPPPERGLTDSATTCLR